MGIVAEEELFLQHHAPYTVSCRGGNVYIIFSDVLVSFGAEDIAFVLVDSNIERHSVLHDRQIEAGEQYVIVFA